MRKRISVTPLFSITTTFCKAPLWLPGSGELQTGLKNLKQATLILTFLLLAFNVNRHICDVNKVWLLKFCCFIKPWPPLQWSHPQLLKQKLCCVFSIEDEQSYAWPFQLYYRAYSYNKSLIISRDQMRSLFMKTKLNENHFYIPMEMKMSQMIIGRQESHWKVYVYFHWSSIESQYIWLQYNVHIAS